MRTACWVEKMVFWFDLKVISRFLRSKLLTILHVKFLLNYASCFDCVCLWFIKLYGKLFLLIVNYIPLFVYIDYDYKLLYYCDLNTLNICHYYYTITIYYLSDNRPY